MTTRSHLFIALALLTCPACAVDEDEAEFRLDPNTAGNSGGGTVFNTSELDDRRFSEITHATEWKSAKQTIQIVDEPNMPGIRMTQLVLKTGESLVAFQSQGGWLVGYDAEHQKYEGDDFLESVWTIKHADWGEALTMQLVEADVSGDLPRYRFLHLDSDGKGAKVGTANCPEGTDSAGNGGDGRARLLSGFSIDEDSGNLTESKYSTYFACNTGATGKAADLGFYDLGVHGVTAEKGTDPWLPLELAIRVIRADYCYEGKSFTEPGTGVFIEDYWGVIESSPDLTAPVEAVWGPKGLLCRGTGRQESIDCGENLPVCEPDVALTDYPEARFITRLATKPGPIQLPPIKDSPLDPQLPTIPDDPLPNY